nr:LOW QUALITY PROTEIN: NACHT, LRR and PYD domains-containing protein 12-like [Misgurnus anguillicaudatus]
MDRSDPSCVSMKSDRSMDHPPGLQEQTDFDFGSLNKLQISESPEPICVSMNSDQSLNLSPIQEKGSDFSPDPKFAEVLNTFRSNLQKKFQCLCEGTSNERNPTLLNEIYTELYITESESGEISNEHEVRQIETQSRRTTTEETPIKCNDIFKPLPEQDKHIRSVLTKGVAGIGKTVSVQKFILDWAEEKENQDVHLIFPLPFREINLMKDKTLSLLDLLHLFFPETKEMEIFSNEYKVLFIFDGLDECRLSLDFHSSLRLCDGSESTSVDVMLTNLIKGNLFPSALIWITSRPAAADLIPSECVDRVTEVRGFSDPQKEEYFRKRISDESLSDQIISHLKSSRSLYIMCHIPVFCWISVTVLERMLSEAESQEIPKTLTEMYTHFLIIQTNIKHQKDYEKKVKDEDMIFKLGKLAFEQLMKGNLIFYDEDLRDCGIDVSEASVYSGLCTQIFREEFGLYQGKVYCFIHLSIQEHLAALYVLYSFLLNKRDLLNECLPSEYANEFTCDTISDLHQRAVDKSLQSKNGHLDLFLRFLLGLSLESNQKLLQDLLKHKEKISWSKEKTVDYIKIRIKENPKPDKSINLFHSLNELGDQSLVNEVQKYIQYENLKKHKLSSSQWSAVVFILLTSKQLDVFKLSKYISRDLNKDHMTSDEVLQKLLPVIEASRSAELTDCELSEKCCSSLTSVLTSKSSCLRSLNLSENKLGGSGVKLLSDGLKNPNCKLEKLVLYGCDVTDEGCAALASALKSNPSHLRELNLSKNNLRDSGVKLICDVLKNPNCKLEKLKLKCCDVTDEGCAALASALRSNSHLRDLKLSDNNLSDSGVKLICDELKNPNCKLEKLKLCGCGVTDEGCAALASALISNPSHLRELNLSDNKQISDSGVKLISDVLKNPNCKLEKLKLLCCDVTDEGCAALASALRSNSHLRDLDLTYNKLSDSGVKLICDGLKNPNCKLEKLKLCCCGVTDEGCAALASALRSNTHLRDLDLSFNKQISDSGKKLLSDLKKDSHYKLKTLWSLSYLDHFQTYIPS